MHFFLYMPLVSNHRHRLTHAHFLLFCFSVLTVCYIVFVYHFKLSSITCKPAPKINAVKLDNIGRHIPARNNFDDKFFRLKNEQPALPLDFVLSYNYSKFKASKRCAPLPNILQLEFYNNYWQSYKRDGLHVQLYGAYYDNRLIEQQMPVVRLLAMINHRQPAKQKTYCQIWFEGSNKATIVATTSYQPIWQSTWAESTKLLYPYMITCELTEPQNYLIPKAVSLVGQRCESASNLLKVQYEVIDQFMPKKDFAVCVRGLSHPSRDLSFSLIEWLEILHQLHVDKVYFNIYDVHPNVEKVLRFYERRSYVSSTRISIANVAVTLSLLQHAILQDDPLNRQLHDAIFTHDCFYRHMYHYKYIAYLVMDMIPMPFSNFTTWQNVIENAKVKKCKNVTRICLNYISTDQKAENLNKTNTEKLEPLQFLPTKELSFHKSSYEVVREQFSELETLKLQISENITQPIISNKTEKMNVNSVSEPVLLTNHNITEANKLDEPVPAYLHHNITSITDATVDNKNRMHEAELQVPKVYLHETETSLPTKAKKATIRVKRNEPNFLKDKFSDQRQFLRKRSFRTCWHNTDFAVLLDDDARPKFNDCSLQLKPHEAQMLHIHLENPHPRIIRQKSLIRARVERVANLLSLSSEPDNSEDFKPHREQV